MTTRTSSKSRKKSGASRPTASAGKKTRAKGKKADERSGIAGAFRLPLFRADQSAEKKSSNSPRASRRTGTVGATRKSGHDYVNMPSWKDLESKKNMRAAAKAGSSLDNISTQSMAFAAVGFVVVFTLYIGNVNSTQHELARVHRLQSENNELRMKLNRVKGEYDYMTGPSRVYERARSIGLVESDPAPQTVVRVPRVPK